jgi:hypothetical protein
MHFPVDLKETECEDMDWIHLAQDRDHLWVHVNIVSNLQVYYNAGNFLTSLVTISFSIRTLHHRVSFVTSDFNIFTLCEKPLHTAAEIIRKVSDLVSAMILVTSSRQNYNNKMMVRNLSGSLL